MSFLKAEWRKLAMANYEISPEVLMPYVPKHTELDIWNGVCYVSLVAFMFKNTRLLNIPIPFHTHFEEVNLRFYVKHFNGNEWKRGVVFIKEIVPKPALTWVANKIYKENYQTLPMKHFWLESGENIQISYEWKLDNKWHKFSLNADNTPIQIDKGSETEFITEHYWGYTLLSDSKTGEYQVRHPRWQAYNVKSHQINVDFAKVYGREFDILNNKEPESVMLAEGSEISVEHGNTLI